MPQFGESITEGHIVRWLKREGENIKEQEPLVEMETAKSVFSYESPFRGKLAKIVERDEAKVSVGSVIAHFDVSEEDAKRYLSLGIGEEIKKAKKPHGLSPAIRSLAKEHGMSLEEVIPLSPIRARIAEKMVLSRQKIPHAGCGVDVDFSAIEKWRSTQEKPPSILPFAMVAVIEALKKHPHMNSSLKEEGEKRWVEQYDSIHLGIAVASEQGLVVPVVHNAEKLSFKELVQEARRLIDGGRKGSLSPQDLAGGTFTINNPGAVGSIRTEQIIPYPQAAIVAINRVVRRPWVVGDAIEIRPIVGLDIAFDHRLIDGDVAIRFLVDVAKNLENFDFSKIS